MVVEILTTATSLALAAGAASLLLATWIRMRRLAREMPRIETAGDLERYAAQVRIQMILALIFLPLFIVSATGVLISAALLEYGPLVLAVPALMVLQRFAVLAEHAVMALPAASPELEQRRDELVHMWRTKPLPTRTADSIPRAVKRR